MENPVISEHRIRGERFYTIEKSNKIAFYTTNIAAARYWVKNVIDGEIIPPSAKEAKPSEPNTP